jgi:lambda family phage minor tail protein L
MARHLSLASVIDKNRIASEIAWIALMEVEIVNPDTGLYVETLRVANNPEDVTFAGQTFTKGAFEFDMNHEAGSVPQMEVVAKDYTRTIQARMEAYRGGTGFRVRLMVINSGAPSLDPRPDIEEEFIVTKAAANNYVVTFTLGADNPLTRRYPFRYQFKDRCPWRYKGVECGYDGDLKTCDFSLQGDNGCAAHGNARNFGGFPGIVRQ